MAVGRRFGRAFVRWRCPSTNHSAPKLPNTVNGYLEAANNIRGGIQRSEPLTQWPVSDFCQNDAEHLGLFCSVGGASSSVVENKFQKQVPMHCLSQHNLCFRRRQLPLRPHHWITLGREKAMPKRNQVFCVRAAAFERLASRRTLNHCHRLID